MKEMRQHYLIHLSYMDTKIRYVQILYAFHFIFTTITKRQYYKQENENFNTLGNRYDS